MSEEQAIYIIGIVAAWMQMGGYLHDGKTPNWKALEKTLCASKLEETAPSAFDNSQRGCHAAYNDTRSYWSFDQCGGTGTLCN